MLHKFLPLLTCLVFNTAFAHNLGKPHTHDNESSDQEISKPTAGTLAQKQTKSAIENTLIGKVVTSFPDTLFEDDIDFSGWNEAVERLIFFVTTNSDNDPLLLAKLAATVSINDSLIEVINGVKKSKHSLAESNKRLTDISTFLGTITSAVYEDKKRQEAQSLLSTLSSYLLANATNVQNQLREPGFDIINKSGNPIYVLVVNDAAGLGKGKHLEEKEGRAIKVDHEKSYPKKINVKTKTSVLIFAKEPSDEIYKVILDDKAQLPCEVGYQVEGNSKTIYVSYTKEKSLTPQTGQYFGLRGVTRNGYNQSNNVQQSDLTQVCGR